MDKIMPVISEKEIQAAYWEGYRISDEDAMGAIAKAQRDADRKAIFLKLASYPRHYSAGIRYLHMPVEDWEEFKKECFTLKEVTDEQS